MNKLEIRNKEMGKGEPLNNNEILLKNNLTNKPTNTTLNSPLLIKTRNNISLPRSDTFKGLTCTVPRDFSLIKEMPIY